LDSPAYAATLEANADRLRKNELGSSESSARLEDLHAVSKASSGARALLSKKGDPRVLGMWPIAFQAPDV